MIKKYSTGALALLLITAILSGCGASRGKDIGEVAELTGVFAGPGGDLSFYPDQEVLVSLSDDYVWLLEGKENDRTYGYVFILGNEECCYDKAEALYLHDGSATFAMLSCITKGDKLKLLLDDQQILVFERRTD